MASEPTKPTWRLRPGEQRALLVLGDLLMAALALLAGIYFWFAGDAWLKKFSLEFFRLRVQYWFYLLPGAWMLLLIEIYDLHRAANWSRTLRAVTVAGLMGGLAYLLIYFTSDEPGRINRRAVAVFFVLAMVLTLIWRWIYIRLITSQGNQRRVLVVGAGGNGHTLAEIYKSIRPAPFILVAYIDDDPEKLGKDVEGFRILGGSDKLLRFIDEMNITDIVVSITGEMQGLTFQTLLDVQERGIEIIRMPTLYEELMGRVPIHHLESDWIIRSFVDEARSGSFFEIGKRVLDIIGSIVGLLILAVLLPFLTIAIFIDSGWPIFYWQERLGRGGREFKIIKFRTMRQDAEKEGKPQMAGENDPRITRVGNFMRITRLDEVPQFWNVLRGEMSIVGPRAERAQWVATFQQEIPFYRARLLVKPGITGWAQINYGYAATVEDTSVKLEYDLYYIKHRSVAMDLVIILRTVSTVLGRKGR
ncbi:MAG: sugar transferase [Chloroflexi bacterium]|nr:sugar transferase [Chloroflexota bacterium]